jgi:DNA-binding MarR family transcriptional regulator
MTREATAFYRFGDLLALARRSWTLRMASELEKRGYPDYRISDAASTRLLLRGPVPVGRFGEVQGVTRQAARKVARGLEERGYATTHSDPDDARKVNVVLTEAGLAYSRAVVGVIASLNRRLAERVDIEQLVAADVVLRAAVDNDQLRCTAEQIPAPEGHAAVEEGESDQRRRGP